MKNKLFLICLLCLATFMTSETAQAQNVGINSSGNPDASAILDLNSTTLGLLIPRMTTTNRDAITTPAIGLILYNTTTNNLNVNIGSPNFVSLINGAATLPLTFTTPSLFGINLANGSTNGYLQSSDWTIFNAKQTLLNNSASATTPGFVKFTSATPSFDNTLTYCSTTGTANYLPKYTASNALGNSLINDNGTNVGIGTALPNSTLQVNGSFATIVTSLSAVNAYQAIGSSNYTILASPSSNSGNGNFVFIQLPTTVGITGRIFIIKNVTGFTLKIKTFSATQTIDGNNYATTPLIFGVGTAGQTITVQTDGNAWYIVGLK